MRPGADAHLTPAAPTAALTRVQTGVGFLRAGLVLPDGAAAPRLGCAWQQGDRQHWSAGGLEVGSRRPVRVHDHPEELDVDLLAVHPLARLLVLAWPVPGGSHPGGGLLVLRSEGGCRVDAGLPAVPAGSVAVLLSGYVVNGELVLRAEDHVVPGGPAQATAAYCYDALRWLDDHQPAP